MKKFEQFTNDELSELEKLKLGYTKIIDKDKPLKDEPNIKDLLLDLEEYDISNFLFNIKPYDISIKFDDGFKKILTDINIHLEDKIDIETTLHISVTKQLNNLIDFEYGIPKKLRGLGIGYKIYKFIIQKYEYITSDKNASLSAIRLWRFLLLDSDLLCYTSTEYSGVALKTINDEKLKLMLNYIKNRDIIQVDKFLEKRIEKIYGTLDTYKQGN